MFVRDQVQLNPLVLMEFQKLKWNRVYSDPRTIFENPSSADKFIV